MRSSLLKRFRKRGPSISNVFVLEQFSGSLWRTVTLALFQRQEKVLDESDSLIAIDGASAAMPGRKRAQLNPSTPVASLAGIFSKYAFTISAMTTFALSLSYENPTNCNFHRILITEIHHL